MRIILSGLAGICGLVIGALLAFALSFWLGRLFSQYEPGAYVGLLLSVFTVPVGSLFGSVGFTVIAWNYLNRGSSAAA